MQLVLIRVGVDTDSNEKLLLEAIDRDAGLRYVSPLIARLAEIDMETSGRSAASRAKELLAKLLLPGEVSGKIVDRYIRKALRTNSWRTLKPENRALLLALRRWRSIKSPTLKSTLYRIFLEIELHTLRGEALFYGIILVMRSYMYRLEEVLKNTAKLLAIGISYLNNPLMYRVYG